MGGQVSQSDLEGANMAAQVGQSGPTSLSRALLGASWADVLGHLERLGAQLGASWARVETFLGQCGRVRASFADISSVKLTLRKT